MGEAASQRAWRTRLLTEMARLMVAGGADADQVAGELLRRSDAPISVIKAVIDATGMPLGDAKWVVHRNLDPAVRAATEEMWQALLDGLEQHQGGGDTPAGDHADK